MPRSGSNFLSYLLHDHAAIASIGEAFCIERVWGSPARPELDKRVSVKLLRDLFPRAFLRYGIFHAYPGKQAVGFRAFYHHLEHFPSLQRVLTADRSIHVIHLIRKNLLANYVSLCVARKTNHWSSLKPNPHKAISVSLSYAACTQHFQQTVRYRAWATDIFKKHPMLTIAYEDLISARNKETERILSFLGVPEKKLFCTLSKQNTRPLSRIIRNYQTLKKQFSNTEWAQFFS